MANAISKFYSPDRKRSGFFIIQTPSSHNKRELFYCPANKQRGGV